MDDAGITEAAIGNRMDVVSRMRPEDMVVWHLEGNWVDGPPNSLQCSEVKIHSCIYKNRLDVVSVVHVHPDYVVLMSVLENGIKPMAQEGIGLVTKPLPLYRRTKRSSPQRRRARRWPTCWATAR